MQEPGINATIIVNNQLENSRAGKPGNSASRETGQNYKPGNLADASAGPISREPGKMHNREARENQEPANARINRANDQTSHRLQNQYSWQAREEASCGDLRPSVRWVLNFAGFLCEVIFLLCYHLPGSGKLAAVPFSKIAG